MKTLSVVKSLALSSLAVCALTSGAAGAFTFKEKAKLSKPTAHLEFDPSNTVVLRGEVSDESVSKLIQDLESSKEDDVLLYIQSPGGSVIAGMKAISYIRSTPKKVTCVADVAISMAFVILQACDERVSTSSSITMQHVTAFGLRQQQAPNAESFVSFLHRMAELMDIAQAKRIGLSYNDFKTKTRSDWWSFGEDVAAQGVTDRSAEITCSQKAIKGTTEQSVATPFGNFLVSWSQCPLVSEPTSVKADRYIPDQTKVFEFQKNLNVRDSVLTLMGDVQ